MRSHFRTVMADYGGKYSDFPFYFSVKMSSKRPSSKWGLSPVNERWLVIRMVAFLMNELKQFGCYNVYKFDSTVDLEFFNSDNNKIKKMLAKHAFILRLMYEICNEMKFYNLTTPLPAVGGIYDMFKANPNPINYETLKYTKGNIGVRVPTCSIIRKLLKFWIGTYTNYSI